MRIVIGMTGASGAVYAQRLLDRLDSAKHEVSFIMSAYAEEVARVELDGGIMPGAGVRIYDPGDMRAAFASGSNPPDAMVVIPCTMGTLGRIAHGTSDNLLLRAADVVLKERRKLILVPRETPLSLVHIRNMELLLMAGALILPACPSFYSRPSSVDELVDTVVARVLDHLGLEHDISGRWRP
ncbi:MAG: UbiX family flavin prenyltransferase [Verrucomicrobia bacterium]|nr:UbiX family flavin prenyltransferase [Verrucomicrobiota bacterium]MCF7707690.1 UbiX family flavin prenyltransferase [Verrucomicrobiota bacterium]